MAIRESNVTAVVNQVINQLNKHQITKEEIPVVLAQLLIYCGKSISNKDIDLSKVSMDDLEREYYSNNKDNDIGLGLVLNGGTIMQALNVDIQKNNSDETANKGNKNVQVSTSRKIPQKSSAATSRPKTSKRITRRSNG